MQTTGQSDTLDALLARQGSVTFTAEQVALLREAVRLADDSARSDVEVFGAERQIDGITHWHLAALNDPGEPEHDMLREAVAYLRARGRINAHPGASDLYHFHGHDPV